MRQATPFLSSTDDGSPLMEINITPLIDVLLVLLIMILITLPLTTHAIKIDLPKGHDAAAKRTSVNIEIDFDGSIYWNDTLVADAAELQQHFRSTAAEPNQPDIRIMANRRAKYDVVAQVLAAAQRNGIRNLGFAGNERFID
jgi:biopolymer transport protein ExbD